MITRWQLMDIWDLIKQGYSARKIAKVTGLARNTVAKYLENGTLPQYKPREKRSSKLDPFKELIHELMFQRNILNAEVLFRKLCEQGYSGGRTIVKDYVHNLRPPNQPKAVTRYETPPGEQAQVDFGEVKYEDSCGITHRLYCFVMILSYSRDLYVEFIRKANVFGFLACHVRAIQYFQGSPKRILYDNAKVVRVGTDSEGKPVWQKGLFDLAAVFGFSLSVHRPYHPASKGKVEASVKYVKGNFWPGRDFSNLADLNRQVLNWCSEVSKRIHGTTGERPVDRKPDEKLVPLPNFSLYRTFLTVRTKVYRDGYVTYDGVRYGVPWSLCGQEVEIRQEGSSVEIFHQDELVARHPHALPGQRICHLAGQWAGLAAIKATRPIKEAMAKQISDPVVAIRSLEEYQVFAGGEVL
jgi:transposase